MITLTTRQDKIALNYSWMGKTVEHMFVGFPSLNEDRSERQCCIFVIYLFYSLTFVLPMTSPRFPLISPHVRGAEKQLPHALFYLLLLSNDCVQILVRPPAPKDSIYQDKHKINTLPTQTAHRRVQQICCWCWSVPGADHKAETPEKKSTRYVCISACYLIFFTNNDNNNLEIFNNINIILNHLDNQLLCKAMKKELIKDIT